MLRNGTNEIRIQRKATSKEIEVQETILGRSVERPYIIEEGIGVLEGLSALSEENNLRKILVEDLQPGIERISSMEIESATEHLLSVESKWAGEIEAKLERAERAIDVGRRLLEKSNLTQLLKVVDEHSDIKLFKAFLNGLP